MWRASDVIHGQVLLSDKTKRNRYVGAVYVTGVNDGARCPRKFCMLIGRWATHNTPPNNLYEVYHYVAALMIVRGESGCSSNLRQATFCLYKMMQCWTCKMEQVSKILFVTKKKKITWLEKHNFLLNVTLDQITSQETTQKTKISTLCFCPRETRLESYVSRDMKLN